MRFNEDELRQLNEWKSVSEVPEFPFQSFAALQAALVEGTYELEISYFAALELAPYVRPVGGVLLNMLLTGAWLIVIICMIVVSLMSEHYMLLLGVPIAAVGHVLGNPVWSLRHMLTKLNVILVIGSFIAALNSYAILAALLAAFVVSFTANRAMFSSNVTALRKAVTKSEALFINQYSKGGLKLRHVAKATNENGSHGFS